MSNKLGNKGFDDKGLYNKYIVSKVDGSPVDEDAVYFVLRLDTDFAARTAMAVYADVVRGRNPVLAGDILEMLWERLERLEEKDE